MNHAVGTTALGRHVLASDGLTIVGTVNVFPNDYADATALLWAGSPDLLDALNYLLEHEGERDARIKALAAIEKATVAAAVKAAA